MSLTSQTRVSKGTRKQAKLRYLLDNKPGIQRRKAGKSFAYYKSNGAKIRSAGDLKRIRALAIPPAWRDVWISPQPNSHLQATGIDARGRKQYRYHAQWKEEHDKTKYKKILAFARKLPTIRQTVASHLRQQGLPREKVLATIVYLLESTLIRVGNNEYAKSNRSYGLTTLQDRHAKIRGSRIEFDFLGKSRVHHSITLKDRRLAKIVKGCQDLPGQELFQYRDENGKVHDVNSTDVNRYLKEIAGAGFTAKDFRTWAGTVAAAIALREFTNFESSTEAKRYIRRAIENVAKQLGNTPAICRSCYVHPEIIASYTDGTLLDALKKRVDERMRRGLRGLKPDEVAVLLLLQTRLSKRERK